MDNSDSPDNSRPILPSGFEPTLGETLGTDPLVRRRVPLRDLTGTLIADYEVLGLIGAGGGGQVYRAQHRRMGRQVAIKILSQADEAVTAAAARFRREVRASAQLMHPNIVTAFDAGEFDQLPYLVMEFVDGCSLYDLVASDGPLSLRQACTLMSQAAEGLAYAHAQGIVHRDVKPSNLMVTRDFRLKILDLGLARQESQKVAAETPEGNRTVTLGPDVTSHGTVVGTAGYISPEQISSSTEVDHRTDIYSLGCTFVFLLTGNPPYPGTPTEKMLAHSHAAIPKLTTVRPDLPAAIDELLVRFLAKDRDLRFSDMREVQRAMLSWSAHTSDSEETVEAKGEFLLARALRLPHNLRVSSREGTTTVASRKAVGLSLGTDLSYVTWIAEDGLPHPLRNRGDIRTPTIVRLSDGEFSVGHAAKKSVEGSRSWFADRFFRDLGKSDRVFLMDDYEFPPELLTAVVARDLAANAQQQIGYFSHVANTVPGCWGDSERHCFQDALRIAYLESIATVNSASALAVHYSYLHGWLNPRRVELFEPKYVLVIRLGAGSFDATVLQIGNCQINVLAIAGSDEICGKVWDDRIVEYIADQLGTGYQVDVRQDPHRLAMLRRQCDVANEALIQHEDHRFRLQIKGKVLEGNLSRTFVHRLGADLLELGQLYVTEALTAAGLQLADLHTVLCAGELTRRPLVQEAVRRWIGSSTPSTILGTDSTASGAAIVAQSLLVGPTGNLKLGLREVTSREVSIRVLETQASLETTIPVVSQHAPLPASGRGTLQTVREGQTSLSFAIVESSRGPRPMEQIIGTCQIDQLPPGLPAGTEISVDIQIGTQGQLSVTTDSLATGRKMELPIVRRLGVTRDDILRWRDWLYAGVMSNERPSLSRRA